MASPLDEVTIYKPAVPAREFNEMMRVFPESHFGRLRAEGFRFYRNTFWYPCGRKPENIFETVVTSLASWVRPPADIVGMEWWFSVGMTNSSPEWILPCHFDRNDLAERDPTKIKFPYRSSVLFMKSVPYGELVITDQVLTPKGTTPPSPGNMRFIKPARNLYAVFPGVLRHGVIGRMWRPEQPNMLRMTMAVNWWSEKPKAEYMQDSRDCMKVLRLEGQTAESQREPGAAEARESVTA